MKRKDFIKGIIKEVNINGLIAIKKDIKDNFNTSIYKVNNKYLNEWLLHCYIANHLTSIKDSARY